MFDAASPVRLELLSPAGSSQAGASFSENLLAWYEAHKRDLPWRRRQDNPYAIWISEIMLQQTTVNAVIGFYERWMERFPTIHDLADAPLDEVLKYWAGLGYYSRARNIKKAAELVISDFDGRMPESVGELLKLPGIGRYTAGAISSIAYNLDAPILDANVIRLLSRVAAIEGDPKSSVVQATLWALAREAIPTGRARNFNQGLMELGALVCTPREPSCLACPVSRYCKAFQLGRPSSYPTASAVKQWKSARHVTVAVTRGDKLLIVKRPENAVWAGLWELPRVIADEGEALEDAAVRAGREVAGIDVDVEGSFATIAHVVMNVKIQLTGFLATTALSENAVPVGCAEVAWVCAEQLKDIAISSPQRRLIAAWRNAQTQPVLTL